MHKVEKHLSKHSFYQDWHKDARLNILGWAMVASFFSLSLNIISYTNEMVDLRDYLNGNVAFAATIQERRAQLSALPQETDRIIVKYKMPAGLSIAMERANLEKAEKLSLLNEISQIGAVVYQVDENDTASEVVARMKANHGNKIEYAEVDMLVPLNFIPNDPSYGSQWHHPVVETPTAWDSASGEGITVAILDTGVNPHVDLALSPVPMRNFYDGSTNVTDVYGHGTLVAGTAAAIGNNSIGVSGIAPKALVLGIKVARDSDGYGSWSAMAQGITYAADNDARVANMSYSACDSASIRSAANYMRTKGGAVTISAGNSGGLVAFTASPDVTCVSATGSNDARTSWSSYGDYVDVAAPGAGILTTTNSGGYAAVSGTSFSAPLTAGIYALMFSANPALTPNQADNILYSTSLDIGTLGWDQYYGHGRVNAAAAVAAAIAAVGTRDTVAPSVPLNFRVTGMTANSVSLAWNASTDDNTGVAGYNIYRDGTKLATVAGTTYTSTGLAPLSTYVFTIRAVDGDGNQSGESTPLSVTTPDVAFGISSTSISTKTSSSATVSALLTKPGTITVKYGTSANSLTLTAESAVSGTSHNVLLSGLSPFTTYYYQVIATDGTTIVSSTVSSFKTSKATGGGKPRR